MEEEVKTEEVASEPNKEAIEAMSDFDAKLDGVEPKKEEEKVEEQKPDPKTEEKGDTRQDQKGFTQDLLLKALKVGIDAKDAVKFSSPDDLEKTVSVLTQSKQEAQKPVEKTEEKDDLDFSAIEEYDPDLATHLKKINDKYASKVSSLEAQVKQLLNTVSQNQAAEFEKSFNSDLNSISSEMGDDIKGLFSDKSNKDKLLDTMEAIVSIKQKSNQKLPDQKELVKQAIEIAFFDVMKESEKKKVSGILSDRSKQVVARPSGRQGVPVNGLRKAVEVSNTFDKKFNLI